MFSNSQHERQESERLAMTELKIEEITQTPPASINPDIEFADTTIQCIDCAQDFIWTSGEQAFFRDKQLQNPPKRCKDCIS